MAKKVEVNIISLLSGYSNLLPLVPGIHAIVM